MTDESTNVDIDIDANPAGLSDAELKASEKGWVPETEWEGDPDQWRPAREFLDRGELMDRISSQTRQLNQYNNDISELKDSLSALTEHNKKIAEQEYKKAMQDLKSRKADALDLGDHSTVVEIDEQMSDLKESKKNIEVEETKPQQNSQQPHPEVEAWMGNNSWYNTDIVLQGAADAIAKQYMSSNPGSESNPGVVLEHVAATIKQEFPERFGQTKRRPAATTEPSNNGSTTAKGKKMKYTTAHLTPEQKQIAKSFAKTGVMTEQEYVNQLAEMGEIG